MSSHALSSAAPNQDSARRALRHWLGEAPVTLAPFGAGHINTTWRVESKSDTYVLQQISDSVFPDPTRIAHNQQRLFSLLDAGATFPYQLPEPLAVDAGETLLVLESKTAEPAVESSSSAVAGPEYWRLCRLIEPARTLQTLTNPQQAEAAGRAFGTFQRLAMAIPGNELDEVIPGFYELPNYLRLLDEALHELQTATDAEGERVRVLVDGLGRRRARYLDVDGGDPCVIHGDCKVNNLLFEETRDVVMAVLDLDTLMVRPWWLDFGDLVRSAVPDVDGHLRAEIFAALACGFFTGRGALAASDVESALQAPGHVAYMLVVRFLEDHMRGDRYFRVDFRGQNLQRAEHQFAELQQFEAPEFQRDMARSLQQLL